VSQYIVGVAGGILFALHEYSLNELFVSLVDHIEKEKQKL
jgi:hypothetical protein